MFLINLPVGIAAWAGVLPAVLLAVVSAGGALAALMLRGRSPGPCPPATHRATMGEAANDAG